MIDAKNIRQHIATEVLEKIQKREIPPIQGMSLMVLLAKKALEEAGFLNDAENTIDLTMGDINVSVGNDSQTQKVAEALGLTPFGKTREKMNTLIQQERENAWNVHHPLTTYEVTGTGWETLRKSIATSYKDYGFTIDTESVLITNGGLEGIYKSLAGIKKVRGNVTLLFPTPGFSPVMTQATMLGIPVQQIVTKKELHYTPSQEDIHAVLKQVSGSCILYLAPINNPTSCLFDLEVYRKTLQEFGTLQPDGVILIDGAYITVLGKEKAREILKILEDTNTLDRTVFVGSLSKTFGYTGLRCGFVTSTNKELFDAVLFMNQNINASLSTAMQLEASAVITYGQQGSVELVKLLRERQQKCLKFLEKTANNLVNLSHAYIDNPLYVYVKLNSDVTATALFIETGLAGIPGSIFGDTENNMVRFSVGAYPFS